MVDERVKNALQLKEDAISALKGELREKEVVIATQKQLIEKQRRGLLS